MKIQSSKSEKTKLSKFLKTDSYEDAINFCRYYGLQSQFDVAELNKSIHELKEGFHPRRSYITLWTGEKFIG